MRYEEGGRALRPQAACGKDYAGGGVLGGEIIGASARAECEASRDIGCTGRACETI